MTSTFFTQTLRAEKQARAAVPPLSALTQDFMNSSPHLHSETTTQLTGLSQPDSSPSGAAIDAIVASMATLAQVRQDALSLNASAEDWDIMFFAVEERLRTVVGKVKHATPGLDPLGATLQMQAMVPECLQALGQLHAALTLERDERRQLDQKIAEVQAALAAGLVSPPTARDPGSADSPASAQSAPNGELEASTSRGVLRL